MHQHLKNYFKHRFDAVLKRPSKHGCFVILLPTTQLYILQDLQAVTPAHCGLYMNRALDSDLPAERGERQPI